MEKNEKESAAVKNDVSTSDILAKNIKAAAEGLSYTSETDAEIKLFTGGTAKTLTSAAVLEQTKNPANAAIEEKDFNEFFSRLTEIQDWFGDQEKETVQKFGQLKSVLENNLRELKVYKIGKTQLNVYVLGLDENDKLLGIKTKAVET